MSVTFKLPKSIPWITSQSEPGTNTKTYIDERFAAVKELVDGAKNDFDASLDSLTNSLSPIVVNALNLQGVDVPDLGADIPAFTDIFSAQLTATMPEFTAEFTATAPVFTDALTAVVPTFSETFTESAPAAFSKTFDATIPEFTESFTTTAPEFTAQFSATLPELSVEYVEPGGRPEAESVQWEDGVVLLEPELVAKIATWLTTDRSAVPEDVEEQIYDAALIRLDEDRALSLLKLDSDVAARGWEIPGGVAANQKIQLEREYSKGAAELSANLAAKNLELTQANYHKAAELATAYVTAAQDYIVKKNTAKIQWYSAAADLWIKQVDAAIRVVESKVAVFAGQVEGFKARLGEYETQANVYATQMSAHKVAAEVFGIKSQVHGMLIDEYKAKADVLKTEADIHRVALDEYKAKADVFKTKADVHAIALEGFKAALAEYQAKAAVYGVMVDAYKAEIQSHATEADIFNSKVSGYKAAGDVYKVEAEVFDSLVKAYSAHVEAMKAKADSTAESVRLAIQSFQAESTALIEEEKLSIQAQASNQSLAKEIANAQSSLHAQMVASGLSAMHVQASTSVSHGTGQDVKFSYSYGESMGEDHRENIDYSEKK